MQTESIQFGTIAMGLLGGLALFLYGMDNLTSALKSVAGPRMRDLLSRLTRNRFEGVFTGAFTTAVIQSSSVTTVLVVGFVAAGLMRLEQSIGIIMGAEIGTTITAQIIAFKVTRFALAAVAVGFALYFVSGREVVRKYGIMLLGLGLVFYGMNLMGEATRPLRDFPPFIDLMTRLENPLMGILFGAAFTALVQSSSATTGVIIVLASQGLIELQAGIALALGANIGTTVTALLAAIGKPRVALRAALVHVVFNVLGVTLWFNFIDQLVEVSRLISPAAAELSGTARLAAEVPRQIANAHTIFNLANTAVFIGFTGVLARIVTFLVPEKEGTKQRIAEPKYLDEELIETPALALDRARMELGHLGEWVLRMLGKAPRLVFSGSAEELSHIRTMDSSVDRLQESILAYLGKVSQRTLDSGETRKLHEFMAIAGCYENIGDMMEIHLVHAGHGRLRAGVKVSRETREIFDPLIDKVFWSVEKATRAVASRDLAAAREIVEAKEEINLLAGAIEEHLAGRLVAAAPHRLETYRIESELVENLKRIFYFAKQIAKRVLAADVGEEREARTA